MKQTLKHRILEYFEEQIYWEDRTVDGVWEYRLLTNPIDIDFERCCLKKKQMALTLNP